MALGTRSGVAVVRRSMAFLCGVALALPFASLSARAEPPPSIDASGRMPTRPMEGVDAEALAEASTPDQHERRIASSHAYEAFLMALRALESGDRGQARHWLRQAIAFDPGAAAPRALLQSLERAKPPKLTGPKSAVRASEPDGTARTGQAAQPARTAGREVGARRPNRAVKSPTDASNVAIDRSRPDR